MRRRVPGLVLATVILTACTLAPTPSPATPSPPAATRSPTPTPTPSPSATAGSATATADPTATPTPPLSLDRPEATDPREVSVTVLPEVGTDGGRITVTVTSRSDERIDELVLRWPTELGETLRLAPFVPSEERIREGGPPLVQPWTKWVIGPGEQGEPEGTTSLGYGPLLSGATLTIPLFVERVEPGAVEFDLQVLAGNDLLALEGGEPAVLRVAVP